MFNVYYSSKLALRIEVTSDDIRNISSNRYVEYTAKMRTTVLVSNQTGLTIHGCYCNFE